MGILDAITSNPGSFFEGWQEETDKRDALAAQEAARLAELAKEDRAFARQKELKNIELGHQEHMADYRATIAEGVEKSKRKHDAEVKLLQFERDLFTKSRETFHAHLKTMGEKGIMPSPDFFKTAIAMKYMTAPQARMHFRFLQSSKEGKTIAGDKTSFDKLDQNISKGAIVSYPGGRKSFMATYGPIWKKLGRTDNINAYWNSISDTMAKNAEKFYRQPTGGTGDKKGKATYKFQGGDLLISDVYLPTSGEYNKKFHMIHIQNKSNQIRKGIEEGTIKPADYQQVLDILDSEREAWNNLNKGNRRPAEILTHIPVRELHYVVDLLRKNLPTPTTTSVSGEPITNSVTEKLAPSETNTSNSLVPSKPTTTSTAPVEDDRNDDDFLNDPRNFDKEHTQTFLMRTAMDNDIKDEHFYHDSNFERKYEYGYLTADHARVKRILSSSEGVPTNEAEWYNHFMNDETRKAKFGKAYLTMIISKKFQNYANNSSDNRVRDVLSKDKEFHRAILDLEELDGNYNATAALGELFLLTRPTHKVPKGHDGDVIKLTKDGMFYQFTDGEWKARPNKTKVDTRLLAAEDNIKELTSTINLLKDHENVAGTSAEVVFNISEIATEASKFVATAKKFINGTEITEGRGITQDRITADNKKALIRFQEKMDLEEKRIKGLQPGSARKVAGLLLSRKIKLAYMLSGQLQGDGTGGGRTISDADFQYALQAMWGQSEEVIATRLEDILRSMKSKQSRLKMYMEYDKTGLTRDVSAFLTPLEEARDARIINKLIAGKDDSPDAPIVVPKATEKVSNMRKYVEQRMDKNNKVSENNFEFLFSEYEKNRPKQMSKVTKLLKGYIMNGRANEHFVALKQAAEEYKKIKGSNKTVMDFYLEKKQDEENMKFQPFTTALTSMSERLLQTYFPPKKGEDYKGVMFRVKNEEGKWDTVFRSAPIPKDSDRYKNYQVVFATPSEEVLKNNEKRIKAVINLNRFLFTTAIEILAK